MKKSTSGHLQSPIFNNGAFFQQYGEIVEIKLDRKIEE